MPFVLKFFIPAITGAVVAALIMFGLVYSQTKAPGTNPASKPIIAYGNKA